MGTALEVNHVWKKFNRGEFNDSLRDAIPAMFKSLVGLGPSREELQKNEFWALKDVDFKVEEGESVALIGHNGAGKSTLLKIFSKILKPNRGSIKVNGRMRALIEIGSGFHGDLTGRENIFLNGSILGMTQKEIASKFDAIVDFSGIEEFLDMPVKRYSSGMYARLGFAVAAHLEPEILIVDEVLSVGDIAFQKKCLGKMDEVTKEGRTVVFVSHNMTAVKNLCPRAILFDHGEMLQDGPTPEIIEEYYKKLQYTHSELSRECRNVDQKANIIKVLVGGTLESLAEEGRGYCHGPFYVRVYFSVKEPIEDCFMSLDFIDRQENHLLGLSTNISLKQIGKLERDGYIDFYIPHIPLIHGAYSMGCAIFERHYGMSYGKRIDHIHCLNNVIIEKQEIPGWRMLEDYAQKCFVPYEWEIH